MYIPPLFAEHDRSHILRLMREHSFATVIAPGDEPVVSQAPTLVVDNGDRFAIEFHLSVHNPHCDQLRDGACCVILFSGPNCYVSPSWNSQHPAVPTWNYVSVEARGPIMRISEDELIAQLVELSRRHEGRVGGSWQFNDLPFEFRQRLLAEIRGFRVQVEVVAAKSKLSQNRTPADRRSVADRLSMSTDPLDQRVGRLMMETFDGTRSPAAL
jgi:transcriptional regulator